MIDWKPISELPEHLKAEDAPPVLLWAKFGEPYAYSDTAARSMFYRPVTAIWEGGCWATLQLDTGEHRVENPTHFAILTAPEGHFLPPIV